MPPRKSPRRRKRGLSGSFLLMGLISLLYSGLFPLFRIFDYAAMGAAMWLLGTLYRSFVKKRFEKEDEALDQLEEEERLRREQEQKRREAEKFKNTGDKQVDELLLRGQQMLYQIRHENDRLPDPVISGQIDEGLERIAPLLLEKWGTRLTATVSGRDWFDITAANKGMGMQMLMQHMGVQPDEVVAFGDNFNDETMLDCVGHPFIMAHANPALLSKGYNVCTEVLPVLKALIEEKGAETALHPWRKA